MTSVDLWAPWRWASVSMDCMIAAAVAESAPLAAGKLLMAAAATEPRMTDGVRASGARGGAVVDRLSRRALTVPDLLRRRGEAELLRPLPRWPGEADGSLCLRPIEFSACGQGAARPLEA